VYRNGFLTSFMETLLPKYDRMILFLSLPLSLSINSPQLFKVDRTSEEADLSSRCTSTTFIVTTLVAQVTRFNIVIRARSEILNL
jgi:hypothetical protein